MSKAKKIIITDERRPDLFLSDSSHLSGFPEQYAGKNDVFMFLSRGSSGPTNAFGDWKRGNDAIIKKLDENGIRHIRCAMNDDTDSQPAYDAIEKIIKEDQKTVYKTYVIAVNDVFSMSLKTKLNFISGDVVSCENANEIKSENRKKKKEENAQKSLDEIKEKKKKEEEKPAHAPVHDGTRRHEGLRTKKSDDLPFTVQPENADSQTEDYQRRESPDNKKGDEKTYYDGEPNGSPLAPSDSSPDQRGGSDKDDRMQNMPSGAGSMPGSDAGKPKRTKSPGGRDNSLDESERERKKIESTIAENIIPAEQAYSDSIGDVELAKIDYAKQLFLKIRDTLEGAVKGLKDAQLDDGLMEKYIAIIALSDDIDDFRDMWTTLEPGLQAASDVPKENFAKLKAICEYYKNACDLFESRAAKALD